MNPVDGSPRPSAARERLLATASALFYDEGIHAVGVDRLVAAASVTRATFYRHYPSKDDLVVAYLQARDHVLRAGVAHVESTGAQPAEVLAAIAAGIGDDICGPSFRGCPFINAAAEYPDPTHPARVAVRDHRRWFQDLVERLLGAAQHPHPSAAAREYVLLRDGAMIGGYLEDALDVRAEFTAAVRRVCDPHARQAGATRSGGTSRADGRDAAT